MIFDICPSPALYPYYRQENDLVVVVDIFRATTTICTAFANGASAAVPVADIGVAQQYKARGYLVGAERDARQCAFADFGNSPADYSPERVAGREIVFTTTNGTRAIDAAKDSARLLIGAFSNIDVVAEECVAQGKRIVVLCAGWNNRINVEDMLFGGALTDKLQAVANIEAGSDAVHIAQLLWQSAKADPLQYVKNTDHYRRLVANGFESDAAYCFLQNISPVLVAYDKADGKLKAAAE